MIPATVSVVSHGHGALLEKLLGQMNAEPALNGLRVVVTLNLPTDTLDPQLFANLQILTIKNALPKSFSANHNHAFRSCETPWFIVLNPDLQLSKTEPFTTLVSNTRSDIGALVPLITDRNGVPQDSVRSNLTPFSLIERHVFGTRRVPDLTRSSRRGAPFYWLAGMCLAIPATVYRAIGGFDERFYLYCEDYDLSARLYAAGYALIVDRTVSIVHDARRQSRRSSRYLLWHISSLIKVWTSAAFWKIALHAV